MTDRYANTYHHRSGTVTGSGGYHDHQQSCANCGCSGHGYRNCQQPITSFGIICYRRVTPDPVPGHPHSHATMTAHDDTDDDDDVVAAAATIEYLLVQRKDSLCFVEFVRGKYTVMDHKYVMHLLKHMTPGERKVIANKNFDAMWTGFWQNDHNRTFMKEYEASKSRFLSLCAGYTISTPTTHLSGNGNANASVNKLFNLNVALKETQSCQLEPEYGFPKGRRNISESDHACACREFKEESGVPLQNIRVHNELPPFTEIFVGCNGVRYRHVYYLAELVASQLQSHPHSHSHAHQPHPHQVNIMRVPGNVSVPVEDPVQRRAVQAVGWFTAEGVRARLGALNMERRALFDTVHNHIVQSCSG